MRWFVFKTSAVAVVIMLSAQLSLPASAANLADTAKCGVVYDKDTAGTPPASFMDPHLAHEIFAARDCLNNKDFKTACNHYSNALAVLGKMDPNFAAAQGPDIEALMQRYDCSTQ